MDLLICFISFFFFFGGGGWLLSSDRRGIPSRLVIFPDENHWVLNHGNRYGGFFLFVWRLPLFFKKIFLCSLKWHYEVFRWFDQFVGDHLYKKDEVK